MLYMFCFCSTGRLNRRCLGPHSEYSWNAHGQMQSKPSLHSTDGMPVKCPSIRSLSVSSPVGSSGLITTHSAKRRLPRHGNLGEAKVTGRALICCGKNSSPFGSTP